MSPPLPNSGGDLRTAEPKAHDLTLHYSLIRRPWKEAAINATVTTLGLIFPQLLPPHQCCITMSQVYRVEQSGKTINPDNGDPDQCSQLRCLILLIFIKRHSDSNLQQLAPRSISSHQHRVKALQDSTDNGSPKTLKAKIRVTAALTYF